MSDIKPDPEPFDPTLEACVEHAVAPYVGLLAEHDLAVLRAKTRLYLATHPAPSQLLQRIQSRPAPLESAEVDIRATARLSGDPVIAPVVAIGGARRGRA